MLNEFVEKILVHERDRKGSIETTQEVEIHFNFVGRYVPPHFREAILTTKEQGALCKKEERKDRLHQNYLRRKANGRQKEYEERTKSEKRRQMEAKKAALRAEDIARACILPPPAYRGRSRRERNSNHLQPPFNKSLRVNIGPETFTIHHHKFFPERQSMFRLPRPI